MSTVFVLKNINPADFIIKSFNKPQDIGPKTKYDVFNPGKVSHVTKAGGTVRVLQRGKVCNKNGNPYDRECGKPCWWHRHAFDGMAMGIPIRIFKDTIYMDGIFCSYSCVYAYLIDHYEKMVGKRNPNYSNSLTLLKQLFDEEFPGEELEPAKDWRLLKDVGNGSLNVQEFIFSLKGIRLTPRPNLFFSEITADYDIVN